MLKVSGNRRLAVRLPGFWVSTSLGTCAINADVNNNDLFHVILAKSRRHGDKLIRWPPLCSNFSVLTQNVVQHLDIDRTGIEVRVLTLVLPTYFRLHLTSWAPTML